MLNKVMKNILSYLLRILVTVLISIVIGLIISKVINQPLNLILEIIGIIMLVVGGLSMMGDVNTKTNVNVNLGKLTSGGAKFIALDRELTAGSNAFAISTGITGLLIFAVTCLIYYF